MKNDHRYDDIIDLPHHVSPTRARMSLYDRAAQFSPFAALTGYEDVIGQTGRQVERDVELANAYAPAEWDADWLLPEE